MVVRQARFDVVEPPPVYLTAGNEHLGKRVLRTFKGRGRGAERKVWGDVVGWLPAAGDDEALWRVRHSDGDEEDLDEGELTESLAAAKEEAAARKKVTEMEFDDEEDGDDDGPTVRTTRAALAAAAAADGDEDDDDAAGEPALVRRDKSLSLGAHGVKPTQLGLQGLRHELIRVQVRDGVGVLLVLRRRGLSLTVLASLLASPIGLAAGRLETPRQRVRPRGAQGVGAGGAGRRHLAGPARGLAGASYLLDPYLAYLAPI